MRYRNLQLRGDDVYLNGELVARLVPGPQTSNRWIMRRFLEDGGHVPCGGFSSGVWRKHETTGYAQVRP